MISWFSRKKTFVALSTTEAEYMQPVSQVVKQYGFRNLTLIHCDNQSCVKLSENPIFHDKSKHIEIKYHFI
jgi:hypothetical protein